MSSKEKRCIVLDLGSRLKDKEIRDADRLTTDINALVLEAVQLEKKAPRFSKGITVVNKESIKVVFHMGILRILQNKNRVSSEFYICAGYIAGILTDMMAKPYDRLVAFDGVRRYAETQNPAILKDVADSCFLIASVFPKPATLRTVNTQYYRDMGAGFYHTYYHVTGKEIGWYMSHSFNELSAITKESIGALREDDH